MIYVDIYKRLKYFDLRIKFQVDREVFVVQGPSGSGKSTILDCIAGIKKPDGGYIHLNENIVFSTKDKINCSIKDRNIGYVFQDYALFPNMTVKDNINFGIKSKGIKDNSYCEKLMDIFKIKHLENRNPTQISGGEKQRVALARALSIKPKLLLLDEPFTALDKDIKQEVYNEFIDFKKTWDVSVILITHHDEEAKLLGDRVINIKDGRVC